MSMRYFHPERRGPLLIVRIANPPHGYFAIPMIPELSALLDAVERDEGLLVVVFTGTDGTFLSHLDPADLQVVVDNAEQVAGGEGALSAMHHALRRLAALPAISIAAVDGRAWGAGCELALACDLRLMSDGPSAGLAMLEAVLGLPPGAGAAYRLRQLLGPSRALHMLLTAKAVDGAEALRLGLVHEVLPAAGFLDHVVDRARQLTFHTRDTIRNLRRCVYGDDAEAEAAHRREQEAYVEALRSATAERRARMMVRYRSAGRAQPQTRMPAFLLEPVFRAQPRLIVQALNDYFDADKARGISGTYGLQIEGRRGGAWTVSIEDGALEIRPGASERTDVTMVAAAKDWVDFITGRVEDVDLFVSNRMRVYGDMVRALEFEAMFMD